MVQRLTSSGSWEFDVATGVSLWSDGTYDILGVPRGDPAPPFDEFVDTLVHPDDRVALRSLVDAHRRTGTAFSTTIRIHRTDGTWATVDLYAEADVDTHGSPVTVRGTLHPTAPRPTA